MNSPRFRILSGSYRNLRVGVVGDFCLDRYLEIDSKRNELSIETGLPVWNVVNVRAQPGGAGTILNNLAALDVAEIYPIGFCGEDGEGYELLRALSACRAVNLDGFLQTSARRTFTYCKPLLVFSGYAPRELNRLDSKNWTPTPRAVEQALIASLNRLAPYLDAIIVLAQVSVPESGVVTADLLKAVGRLASRSPKRLIIGDSRLGLTGWPRITYKMNDVEFNRLRHKRKELPVPELLRAASDFARQLRQMIFVTLAKRGMIGADPNGESFHISSLPVRGRIDIVGAGDAVTANLATSLAAGATMREAMEIASAAASVVIHQLGTTGSASVESISALLASNSEAL